MTCSECYNYQFNKDLCESSKRCYELAHELSFSKLKLQYSVYFRNLVLGVISYLFFITFVLCIIFLVCVGGV